MTKVFDKYAKYYDVLYMDKDYEKECDFIEEAFHRYLSFRPIKILDAGCGIGGHLIPLTRRGYSVTGIDLSEAMVNIAKKKIENLNISANIYVMDIRNINLNETFDACICMFAVVNYLITNEDLTRAFKSIRPHLKSGALLIFDFWYGPAVLTIKPSVRVKEIEKDGVKIQRTVIPELDMFNHLCKSNYHLMVLKKNTIIDEANETHVLRYLFPQELVHYLSENGFELLKLCEFPELDKLPSENTWNVAAVARAT